MGCDASTSVDNLSDSSSSFLDDSDFGETSYLADDIFSLLESLDDHAAAHHHNMMQDDHLLEAAGNFFGSPPPPPTIISSCKRQKVQPPPDNIDQADDHNGEQRMAHITVERNRRKQMNHHLTVLRSLMPSFYVKRGDQASIIGGVIDYINELQQVLQSLQAKKQRKLIYTHEVLSPRLLLPSPRPPVAAAAVSVGVLQPTTSTTPTTVLSPRKPPLSPRIISSLPISPRTPQPTTPYGHLIKSSPLIIPPPPPPPTINNNNAAAATNYPNLSTLHEPPPLPSPSNSVSSTSQVLVIDNSVCVNELAATSKSNIADVEVKFSSQNNLLLKTKSPKIPGQAVKIISALESLALEILHVSVTTIDETMLNSFTIKIGIECQLSAEELAQQIQQTFC